MFAMVFLYRRLLMALNVNGPCFMLISSLMVIVCICYFNQTFTLYIRYHELLFQGVNYNCNGVYLAVNLNRCFSFAGINENLFLMQ